MDEISRPSPRGEATRDALLDAATLMFARQSFESANLREISVAARVNPALIGYHFHNKEGLYLAVFERMVAQMAKVFDPVMAIIDRVLAEPPGQDAEHYLQPLLLLMEGLLVHMVREHPAWGELFVREQQSPSAAFELLFNGVISRVQRSLVGLVGRIRKDDDPEQVCLLAATIASQVIAIRNSRTALKRLMQWQAIGDRELDVMKAMLRRNTTLLVLGD